MKILVTAGPTREPLDPVRFISNYSTGAMGYAIASAARKRAHKVVLITGPTALKLPKAAKAVPVNTAIEMFKAVQHYAKGVNCVIMAAAVSDFRPAAYSNHKIKRAKNIKAISLVKNPDILYWLGAHKKEKILVGFCMETEGLLAKAKRKFQSKNLDIIIANKIDKDKRAFGKGRTDVILISKGSSTGLNNVTKGKIAAILLDKIEQLWYKKTR